jgi:hypothetical protein
VPLREVIAVNVDGSLSSLLTQTEPEDEDRVHPAEVGADLHRASADSRLFVLCPHRQNMPQPQVEEDLCKGKKSCRTLLEKLEKALSNPDQILQSR